MKTCQAMFNQCLSQLGLNPSEFDEADRAMILSQMHEIENEVMRETLCATDEYKLILEQNQTEYFLPENVLIVDQLIVNDSPVRRASADAITRLG